MSAEECSVGRLVKVEARTWPGINKHGGIGRILRLNEDEVDVQYVLGGREKGVPLQYVSIAEDYEAASRNSLRDRSILLGRCRNCGSLRADCGSCDWRQQEQQPAEPPTPATTTKRRPTKRVRIAATDEDSSSDDSLLLPLTEWKKRQNATNEKLKKLGRQILDSSEEEESDSSDDDQFLIAFQKNHHLRRNLALLNRFERETAPKKKKASRSRDVQSRSKATKTATEMSEEEEPLQCQQTEDEAYVNVDADDIGDADMTQAFSQSPQPPPRSRELASPAATAAQSPLPLQDNEMLVDNDLDGFIQPEGAATSLPRDNEDKTTNLAFVELPAFFQENLHCIHNALPKARAAFTDISRRVEIRKAVGGAFLDLEEEGWQLYDSTKDALLLGGLDQCRNLFRRLNSRKEFRKHEGTLSDRQRRQFEESARSTRDILFDQADKDVEDFLRELRRCLLYDLKSSRDDELFGEADSEQSRSDQDVQQPFQDEDDGSYIGAAADILPEFDPHMHARRLRKDYSSKRSRRSTDAGRTSRRRRVSRNQHDAVDPGSEISDQSSDLHPRRTKRVNNATEGGEVANPSKGASKRSRNESRRNMCEAQNNVPYDPGPENGFFEFQTTDSNTSSVPALDALLASAAMGSNKLSGSMPGVVRRGDNQIAAVDRMQAFLDANSDNVDEMFEPVGAINRRTRRSNGSAIRKTSHESQVDSAIRRTGHASQVDTTSTIQRRTSSSIRPLDEDIFQALANSEPSKSDMQQAQGATYVADYLRVIRSRCDPLPFEDEFLQRVLQELQSADAAMSRDDVVSVFSLAHLYLKKNTVTLQELVATDHLRLSRHSDILVALLMLLKMDLHHQLQQCDGVVFDLFSGNQPCPFVQLVILQLLDVLFAFFHSDAWAMEGRIHQVNLLVAFSPLRNALACFVPLLEISCQYILNRVECQQWWKSHDGSKCFVSSVDPTLYRTCLETAKMPKPVNVRMKQFNSKIPRVEVNVIWSIVGFLASADVQIAAPKSKNRWHLVYTIMCCETGILPKSLDLFEKSSSSEAHVARCENELGYLSLLVARGAMMPLEGTDKIVAMILKRSILLQARCSDKERFLHLFRLQDVAFEKGYVLSHWEASALRSESTVVSSFGDSIDFFLSGLLQKGIDVLASWTSRTKEKAVLWAQLASSISKLQELEQVCSTLNDQNGKDLFARAFVTNERDRTHCVREASVHVMAAFDVLRSECTNMVKKPVISRDVLSKTWFQISNAEMKFHQEALLGKVAHGDPAHYSDSPFTQYFSAIRTFCMYVFAHLGVPTGIVGVEPNAQLKITPRQMATTYHYVLHEALSYIFASLDCMCRSISKSRDRESTAMSNAHVKAICLAVRWISQISCVCRQLQGRSSSNASIGQLRSELQIVGRSVLKLGAKALRNCLLVVLSLSNCEGTVVCVRMCITAIRCVAAWTAETLAEDQLLKESDEFGDLDDSMLLSMDSCNDTRDTAAEILCRTLGKLIELADPSNIYDVNRNVAVDQEFTSINSHGRMVLSRFAGGLCACLSSLIAARSNCDLKNAIVGNALGQPDKCTFKRNVNFSLLAGTCKLAERYAPCRTFMEQRCEIVTLSFVDMTLDADSIERFPTCDLQTMMNLTGSQGARRERKRLDLVNDLSVAHRGVGIKKGEEIDELGPAFVSNHLWQCFRDLRSVVDVRKAASPLFSLLASTDYATVIGDTDGPYHISMEMECLRRMRLLQSFFHVEAAAPMLQIFEETLVLALKSAMMNVLKISDGLVYHSLKRSRSKTEKDPLLSHKHGKLKILQTCYVEMFIAVVSSVVLANWSKFSGSFKGTLSNVREVLFFSMTNYEENDVDGCFRRFLGHPPQLSDSTKNQVSTPMLDLRKCVKYACMRRSKEIVRHHLSLATTTDRRRGAIALVASVSSFASEATISSDKLVEIIAEGFRTKLDFVAESGSGRPIFEDYVDEIIINSQKELQNSEASRSQKLLQDTGIRTLRRFVLAKVIPPRLRNNHVSDCTKASLVGLANRLLYIELDDSRASTCMSAESVLELHELLRSSWDVMYKYLYPGIGSADISSRALRCLSLVMALPLIGADGEPTQSLLGWCQSSTKQVLDAGGNVSSLTRLELFACYVSTYATLAYHVATALGGEASPGTRSKMDRLFKSNEEPRQDLVNIVTPSRAAVAIELLASQLQGLNTALLTGNKENTSTPRNVYAKKPKTQSSDGMVAVVHEVPPEVKREAANLKAVLEAVPSV